MLKRFFAILLVLMLILSSIPSYLGVTASVAAEPSHQTEVPVGYIGVYTLEDLNNVRNNLSGHYILMNDIDLTEATGNGGSLYNGGQGWIPIGTHLGPFKGTFDGNGYKISGLRLSIKSDKIIYAGLFGYIKEGKILNLGMENGSIHADNTSLDSATSKSYAGGIVGYGYNLTVSNSYNTGIVTAQSLFDGYAGGIAGYVNSSSTSSSIITHNHNTGSINAKTSVGGIAGEAYRTQFNNVHNRANLATPSSKNTGGIVGYVASNSSITDADNTGNIQYASRGGGIAAYASSSFIKNSSNEGDLSSTVSWSEGGGIVGYGSSVTISQSYNSGRITTTSDYSDGGGIAGALYTRSSISESFNNGDISAKSYASGIAATVANSVISQVNNTGTITGLFSGGIVSSSSDSVVVNSFNIGTLRASSDIGGIVAIARTGTAVKNTYNAGQLSPIGYYYSADRGGIVGDNEGVIENSFYLDKANTGVGKGIADGAYRVTFEKMKDKATYVGFDFESVWKLDETSGYLFPSLTVVPAPETEHILDMTLTSSPNKTVYIQGEELDLTGAVLTVRTNHGKVLAIPVSNDMVTGFDTNNPGIQTIQVSYKGHTTVFNVSIKGKYTVTFMGHDGTVLKTEQVVEGEPATAPVPPVREGYTFVGWSTNFSSVNSNLTVTALYDIKTYNVTYKDGEEVLFAETYNHGNEVYWPTQPAKEGYKFLNWYVDPEFKTQFTFYKPIYNDLSLYAKFVKIPNTPKNIGITVTGYDKVKIIWTPVEGADGYIIDRDTSSNGRFNYSYFYEGNISGVTIDFLEPGVTYYFKVKSYRYVDGEYIESPDSQLVNAKPILKVPTSPKATSAGYKSVKITWGPSTGAIGYEVHRADSPAGTYTRIATLDYPQSLSYTNGGLQTGKTFYYKVRAYQYQFSKKVYSLFSPVVSVAPVLAGSSAKATSAGYEKVRLTWTKSPEATGYELYRADSSAGTYRKVTTNTNNSTYSYTNSGLTTGKKYYYKIRAYKTVSGKSYYSSYSSVISATPVLRVTTAKAASAGYNRVKVSWTLVSEAHGYEIYRATSKTGTYSNIKTITSGRASYYINGSLTTGKTYYYKVRAYRVIGSKKVYSGFSGIVSSRPVLAAPAKISLAKVTSTSIRLSWYKVSESSGYEIFRSTSQNGTYTRVKTITSGSTLSFTNTSLTRGRTYYYKIRSYKVVNGKKYYSTFGKTAYYKL